MPHMSQQMMLFKITLLSCLDFGNGFLNRLNKESLQLLNEAASRLDPASHTIKHVVFHIELYSPNAFTIPIATNDASVHMLPSILSKEGSLISPVCISVKASSNESAKPRALREVAMLCALLTLANDFPFQTKNIKWTHNIPSIQFIDNLEQATLHNLYPFPHQSISTAIIDNKIPERSKLIWDAYHELSEKQRRLFSSALFAFYSARTSDDQHSTQAIVAYIAALSSLAKNRKQKCSIKLICPEHGQLDLQHDLVGDKAAIASLVSEILELSSEEKSNLHKLMKRAYSEQRSSFVHDAIMRNEEYSQGYNLPTSFPGNNHPIRSVFIYKQDLMSLARITRATLLKWLSKNADIMMNDIMKLDEGFFVTFPVEASITLPSNTVVAPVQGINGE